MTDFTKTYRIGVPIVILLIASLACRTGTASPVSQSGAPVVNVQGPLTGQNFPVGEPIPVDSTSVDPDGVERVELWIDGSLLRVDNNPSNDSPYIVTQQWQGNAPGTHVITVKAFDTLGTAGESQPTVITLEGNIETTPLPTSVAHITPTPDETSGRTPTRPPATNTLAPTLPTVTATSTPSPTSSRPVVMCTPPPCRAGEVYYCPGDCPGGCGTECATPTPTFTPPVLEPTGIKVHSIFEPIWEKESVRSYLGYPINEAVDDRQYAKQVFERGYLYWWDRPDDRGLIWVIQIPQPEANQGPRWSGPYEDIWDGENPYSCDAARATSNGPVRGFGKLWCDHPEIAQAIGTPQEEEGGTGASTNYGIVQFFQNGVMLYSPLDHQVLVLFNGGSWLRYPR